MVLACSYDRKRSDAISAEADHTYGPQRLRSSNMIAAAVATGGRWRLQQCLRATAGAGIVTTDAPMAWRGGEQHDVVLLKAGDLAWIADPTSSTELRRTTLER